MSESEKLHKSSLCEIEFCMLEESRFEEFILNCNQWWTTTVSSKPYFSFIDFPRLTKEEFDCHITDGTVMFFACLKGTDEMVGISGLQAPKVSKGKLTSAIILGSVKTEYRQFGIGQRLIDEAIEIAKRMGIERVSLNTNFYEIYLTKMFIRKKFTLTGTIVEHKSSYSKNWFLAAPDYIVFNWWMKTI